jgi:hypothetical protein
MLAAALAAGIACDDRSTFPRPVAPTPTAPAQPSILDATGSYTLTVEADAACVDLPEAVKKRTYQATIGSTVFTYMTISIMGGGFTKPTVVGELWYSGTLDWNNFDIGGCDGYAEPLDASRSLMICGGGTAHLEQSSITSSLNGQIWVQQQIGDQVQRTSECSGMHRFTFQRTAS